MPLTLRAGAKGAVRARPARAPRSVHPSYRRLLQGAALLFLAGDLTREDVAVDVRVDGGEEQALEFVRLQRLHFPLDRAVDVETLVSFPAGGAVAAPERRSVVAVRLGPVSSPDQSALSVFMIRMTACCERFRP
ncbi:hypothetical protein [Streptomyces lavendulae]